jgi:hypothetical protein
LNDKPQLDAAKAALTLLINDARDFGTAGYDKTYGYGVVGESLRVALK